MLIVERKLNSSIRIGSDIRIRVIEVPGRRRVRLGLEVPTHTRIWREERGAPSNLRPAAAHKPALRTLVICDAPERRQVIERGFRRAGDVQHQQVGDLEEAWRLLWGRADPAQEPPHLLLIDLEHPDPDAVRLLHRLRRQRPRRNLPVVVLGSEQCEQEIARCLEAGATACLERPEEPEELAELIIRIAEFWRQNRLLPAREG